MISIIVPVYNTEKYLPACLDSIVNQSFNDFELILVNDGSTDNSKKICDEYAKTDRRIKVVNTENQGVSAARNTGIICSSGEYICFVDSDDTLDKDYLSILLGHIIQSYDLVLCGYYVEKDSIVENKIIFSSNKYDVVDRNQIFFIVEKFLFSAPWCKIFKSSIIKGNNIKFNEDMSLGEDLVFNFDYLNHVKHIFIINKCLYHYSTDNASSLLRQYRKDLLTETNKIDVVIKKYIDIWDIRDDSLLPYYRFHYSQYESVLNNIFHKDNKENFFTKNKLCNFIIKSNDFQNTFVHYSRRVSLYKRVSYRLRNYLPVAVVSCLRRKIR